MWWKADVCNTGARTYGEGAPNHKTVTVTTWAQHHSIHGPFWMHAPGSSKRTHFFIPIYFPPPLCTDDMFLNECLHDLCNPYIHLTKSHRHKASCQTGCFAAFLQHQKQLKVIRRVNTWSYFFHHHCRKFICLLIHLFYFWVWPMSCLQT